MYFLAPVLLWYRHNNILLFNFRYLHRKECVERSCDYVFAVDSMGMLDHAHTLQKLIEINRLVVLNFNI
jgi:hypothetical protein